MPGAEEGLRALAEEIESYWAVLGPTLGASARLAVVLPSGTGATGLYVARHVRRPDVDVHAVACVGDGEYLRRQLGALDGRSGALGRLPKVLEGSEKHRFGTPSEGLGRVWGELRDAGLRLDLLYAPYAWSVVFERWEALWGAYDAVMYVHTGGLEGLASQLARYRRQGWLTDVPD
jgi:1-aminocyclopropane-1-carboxylate deaminase/D-cysteine desulfhydrase-like pyridoxal-dependent ACC family enzyme